MIQKILKLQNLVSQPRLNQLSSIATVSGLGSILISSAGFALNAFQRGVLNLILLMSAVLFVYITLSKLLHSRFRSERLKEIWLEIALIFSFILSVLIYSKFPVRPDIANQIRSEGYTFIIKFYVICMLGLKFTRLIEKFVRLRVHPAQVVALSFALAIGFGTLLLMMPRSVAPNESLSFIDALFTSTSATCVTGLVVVDTGTHFSQFGQLVILALIQIGGLGIMTITAFFGVVTGQAMGIKEQVMMRDLLDSEALGKLSSLIVSILTLTLIFEAIGAACLYASWRTSPDFINSNQAIYYSIFHSISAFCNAGFALFEDNMMSYRSNPGLNLTISGLIIFGGLGFTVVQNLINSKAVAKIRRRKPRPLSVHTKLVLITSASLILLGWVLILIFEWYNRLFELPFKDKLLAAYFQSATTRTAGFNTIDISTLTNSSYILMIYLMFIGASPGSCGGGIKTSTFATLLGALISKTKGRDSFEIFKRTIPEDMVNKALLIIVISLMLLATFSLILTSLQPDEPLKVIFELVSAFGTVGLSAGLTPKLSDVSKLVVIIMMFIGRIGPLTLALAIKHGERVNYEYPSERIMIG